jgi:hypothetical protein
MSVGWPVVRTTTLTCPQYQYPTNMQVWCYQLAFCPATRWEKCDRPLLHSLRNQTRLLASVYKAKRLMKAVDIGVFALGTSIDPAIKYSEPCRRCLRADEGQTFTFFNCRINRTSRYFQNHLPRRRPGPKLNIVPLSACRPCAPVRGPPSTGRNPIFPASRHSQNWAPAYAGEGGRDRRNECVPGLAADPKTRRSLLSSTALSPSSLRVQRTNY